MFESRKALEAKLEASEAEVTRLEGELAASEMKVLEAVNKDEEIAALEARLAETEAAGTEMAKQSAEIAATLATREAELTAAKESAGVVATEMLAEAAHPPVSTEIAAPEDGDILAEYKKLPFGQQRADFRKKHPKFFAELGL